MPLGKNYTVQPSKLEDPLNGVTTFDLILISKHILGIEPFKSPYQYIAADINKSGSISAFDLVQMRQLILNIIPEFPNNESWRFVANDYQFTTDNPADEAFTETIAIGNLEDEWMEFDFVGVKVGDINGTAAASLNAPSSSRKTMDKFNFSFDNRLLRAGEQVTIPFSIKDLDEIEGLQFALDFKELKLTEVVEGLANFSHLNTENAESGQLAVSWNKQESANQQAPLFILTFVAQKNGLLSDLLSISEERMVAEAYTVDNELQQMDLAFTTINQSNNFELFQNKPNPFNTTTNISFYLPTTEKVSFKVMDLQGKTLHQIHQTFDSGLQEIIIHKEALGSAGILYYQLTVGSYTTTKKMVVLD